MNIRNRWNARAAAFLLCLALLAGPEALASGAWSVWKGGGGSYAGWTVVEASAPSSGSSPGWSAFHWKAVSGSSRPAPGGAPAAPPSGGESPAGGGGSVSPGSGAPPGGGAAGEDPAQPAPSGAAVDRAAEAYLFERLNEERAAAGREPLASDPSLVALARKKALDMALNQYFSHVSPAYGTVFDMLRAEGIGYKWAGENIGRGGSAASIHRGFVDSPEHRANLLSAGYTHVGVGAVRYRGKPYVAQVFTRPR